MEIEKSLLPKDIAEMFGVDDKFVRTACRRKGEAQHPLPCINVATPGKRDCFRIRPSVFKAWLAEEEALSTAR